jgi:monoamine oxidase
MSAETYDAVVVGAGPAGSAAAYTLASAGKTVCLIDKAVFPRDKLCGGGLTFRSKIAFERVFRRAWKPDLVLASRSVSFFSKGRFLAAIKLNTNLYFTSRATFDLDTYFRQKGLDARDFKVKGRFIPIGEPRRSREERTSSCVVTRQAPSIRSQVKAFTSRCRPAPPQVRLSRARCRPEPQRARNLSRAVRTGRNRASPRSILVLVRLSARDGARVCAGVSF